MKISAVTLATVASLAVAYPTLSASQTAPGQTTPGQTESRGVRVLRPEPPPPAPAPAPPTPAPPTVVAPIIKLCARPAATPDIRLPVANFDQKLARLLRSGRRAVIIDLDKPFPQKAPPPAPLDRWLSEVNAQGGQVVVRQYCDSARGGLGSWLAKLFGVDEPRGGPYRAARAYDVVLHADALDRVVTQVEFVPKTARAKP